jgi:hypothetical protein
MPFLEVPLNHSQIRRPCPSGAHTGAQKSTHSGDFKFGASRSAIRLSGPPEPVLCGLGRPYISKSCGILSLVLAFSGRASTGWSIGMTLPSFCGTTVRPAFTSLVKITFDSPIVAFVKLGHATAGVYMSVCLHRRESAN